MVGTSPGSPYGNPDSPDTAGSGAGSSIGGGRRGPWDGGMACDLAPLASKLPAFLVRAVGLSGSLRALASCQAVSRGWRDALGGDTGKDLFGSIVRASGVSAGLRPAVWQTLVLRAVGGGGDKDRRGSGSGVGGGGGGSGSGKDRRGNANSVGSGDGGARESFSTSSSSSAGSFARLIAEGRAGPHAALIARDVPRAFGAVAPHKRRDSGTGGTKSNRGSLMGTATTPGSATTTPKTGHGGGSRRRMTMGGAQGGGGRSGEDDDRGPFGGEGLGFFGNTVGGALTNLLGGSWGRDDDGDGGGGGNGPIAASGTPPRRGRAKTPNHRRASTSVSGGGLGDDGSGGGGPFSWLNPNSGVSPGAARSSASVRNAGRSASPPRGQAGGGGEGGGGFTLAAFPLSPFANLGSNSGGGGGGGGAPPGGRNNADRPRPPSPDRSPGVAPTEEGGSGPAGQQVSPAVQRRRMTIGSGGRGGGGGVWSPASRRDRAIASPATTPAAGATAAAATTVDGWGSSTTDVSGAGNDPARQAAEGAEIESGGLTDDAAWLAKSEEAWAAVPVESKRECLGNVLLAIAARFPDVGYCQVTWSPLGPGCNGVGYGRIARKADRRIAEPTLRAPN